MYNSDYLIYFRPEELNNAVKAAIVKQVMPDIRAAIQKASDALDEEFSGGSPFANDFIQEKIVHQLANLFNLSDVEPENHIRPHQLDDRHVRFWLGVKDDDQSQ